MRFTDVGVWASASAAHDEVRRGAYRRGGLEGRQILIAFELDGSRNEAFEVVYAKGNELESLQVWLPPS